MTRRRSTSWRRRGVGKTDGRHEPELRFAKGPTSDVDVRSFEAVEHDREEPIGTDRINVGTERTVSIHSHLTLIPERATPSARRMNLSSAAGPPSTL